MLSKTNQRRLFTVFVCAASMFPSSCSEEPPTELLLFDFESDADLDQVHWKCFTLLTLSPDNVTHGNRSLRMALHPSNYPGLAPKLAVNDWHGFKELRFDIHNPQPEELSVTVRIDDREDYPRYADRYNHRFVLKPGMNRVRIPLDSLVTSGTNRMLDLRSVYRLLVFMAHPAREYVLYLDYVRLVV